MKFDLQLPFEIDSQSLLSSFIHRALSLIIPEQAQIHSTSLILSNFNNFARGYLRNPGLVISGAGITVIAGVGIICPIAAVQRITPVIRTFVTVVAVYRNTLTDPCGALILHGTSISVITVHRRSTLAYPIGLLRSANGSLSTTRQPYLTAVTSV